MTEDNNSVGILLVDDNPAKLFVLPKGLGLAYLIKPEYVRCRTDSAGS